MADSPSPAVVPFRALRYTARAGDPACLLAPPYDVISAPARAALAAESPHNVVHVELPGGEPGDERIQRTRATLRAWRRGGLLERDPRPALYLHEQVFAFEGTRTRRGFFALVRLPEPGERLVLPHEATLAGPLQERKALLAALRVQTSPILLTYRARGVLLPPPAGPPEQHVINHGEEHRLWRVEGSAEIAAITATIAGPLYIADGHHRYATAVALRDEVRSRAKSWRGDEPEAFVLAELVPVGEMTVLAWHRMVKPGLVPADFAAHLERFFAIETVPPASLHARLAAAGRSGTAFGVLAGGTAGARLLTVRDPAALAREMPQDRSRAWRSLDVAVLEHTVIRHALGLDAEQVKAGALRYTYDPREAAAEVEAGRAALAVLLNPTPLEQVMAVADDGELMPQKSTCFHPKLPTGLVLYGHGDVEEREEEARP